MLHAYGRCVCVYGVRGGGRPPRGHTCLHRMPIREVASRVAATNRRTPSPSSSPAASAPASSSSSLSSCRSPTPRAPTPRPHPSGWRALRTRRPAPRRWQGRHTGGGARARAARRSSSAAARAAQPASAIWVLPRSSTLSFVSPPRRRRRRTCRRRRRHEGGEALIAERVASEIEILQRGQPPQGRREGHQPRVADGSAVQTRGARAAAGRLGPGRRRAPRRPRRPRA